MALNLPEDWGGYYGDCALCGDRFHRSGVVTCRCVDCPCCEEPSPPEFMEGGLCSDCFESDAKKCGSCGDWLSGSEFAGDICIGCLEEKEGDCDENHERGSECSEVHPG